MVLAKETVRRWMREAGLWIPRKQRPPKLHQPRNRRACLGEPVQIDGSDHRWFEERAPACTLLVFIDDATGRLMALHFTATESTFSYFEATRHYLEQHGKPVALYSDKASVFHCNSHSATPGKGVTQFGRALYELNEDTFCANSSQAKGRVERANLTAGPAREGTAAAWHQHEGSGQRLRAPLHGGLQWPVWQGAEEHVRRPPATTR